MNRLFFILVAVCLLAGSGCRYHIGASPCNNPTSVSAPPPPAPAAQGSAQVTYPYYTTRGPRDYFDAAPMDIGY